MQELTIHTDGGARGNPGPAGIGITIKEKDKALLEFGAYIGPATNNEAEYTALITALERAKKIGTHKPVNTRIHCYLDSELVVKQLNGVYKLNNPRMRALAEKTKITALEFAHVSYTHIPREKNSEADALYNEAIDKALSK